ncbi:MAG: dockerin type I repeat-containing protein, partial [Bacteroidales bacterium]|nr:dockerin type I repeat-containing protein [Bacteroidales bacterium]
EQVATVTYDNSLRTFVVTATDDPAMIGKSATITITINGIEETCQVTVGGEVYPITIAGTKVNSVNSNDVLGDGKVRYAAGTLYLNGVQAVMGSQDALRFTASETLPVLNIDVEGENMLHSNNGVGISLQGDAIVSGSGTLIGSGAIYGLLGSSANLTVTGDALVHTVANSIGMRIGSLYVNSKNAQVKTNGFNNSSLLVVNKDLWGNITEPAGAYLDADGYVSLGGNVVKNQYVVINGMAGQSVVPGDVNGDGECTGSDVTALYNHILFGEDTPIFNGDQNGDGEVTGSDVTAVYNIILGL